MHYDTFGNLSGVFLQAQETRLCWVLHKHPGRQIII